MLFMPLKNVKNVQKNGLYTSLQTIHSYVTLTTKIV